MKVKISESNKKISLEDINKFQKKWKIVLPNEYIEFMLESNGGISDSSCLFKSKKKNNILNGSWVRYFYNLDEINKFLKLINNPPQEADYPDFVVYKDVIKTKKIPIARGDSYILCMDISSKDSDGIYFLYLEDDRELTLITEKFRDFINSFEYIIFNEFENIFNSKDFNKLKILIMNGLNPNSKFSYGEFLVNELARFGELDLLKILIEKGAPKDKLLIHGVLGGNYQVVKYLINIGCDINTKNDYGTSLFFAGSWNKDIVKLLLENGIDINIKNNMGEKAIDWIKNKSKSQDKNEIIRMLEEADKIQNSTLKPKEN